MGDRFVVSKMSRLLAAAAIAASGLAVVAAPATAEGPCGVPIYSGDINRVGNLVFVDNDDDGRFEPADGDAGLGGVTVELWADVDFDGVFEPQGDDAAGRECTTTTNPNGKYWFHDVASGIYFIAVGNGVPATLQSSTGATTNATIDNRDDGAPSAGYASVSAAFTLNGAVTQPLAEASPGDAAGSDETEANGATTNSPDADSNLTIDFGFSPASAPACLGIGNRVWLDLDNNGIADGGEPGINGVTLELFAANAAGDPAGAVLQTATTSNGGYYLLSCVTPGRYVVVIPASNFTAGRPLAGLNPSVSGPVGDQANDGAAAGNGSIVSGPVDLVANGAPVGEPDKPAGAMDFDNPSDGDVDTEIDFGFTGMTLGNRVWEETLTVNGIQDAGEPGIAAVTVELWASDGNDPTGNAPLATTNTDSSGYYLFTGLDNGDYVVRIPASNFTGPLNNYVSTPGNGTAPDPDSNPSDRDDNGDGPHNGPVQSLPVSLLAATEPTGEADTASAADSLPSDDNANVTVDFGFVQSQSINPALAGLGDRVWLDANANGVQDANETSVPNVTVVLRDANGNSIATTSTDTNGLYRFDELQPGTYQVCFDLSTLPAGSTVTTANVPGDDAADSDPAADGCTATVTLTAGEFNPTLDLGIIVTTPLAPTIDLAIDKTGSFANKLVTWTIVVTNNGPTTATDTIVVTDELPNDVTFESASGTGFACTATGQTVSCLFEGDLATGQSATLKLVTKMNSAADCTVTNAARVVSSGASATDSNAANNTDSASLTAACVKGDGTTRLPVTGSSAAIIVALALFLGLGGWRLNAYSTQLKAIRLSRRLGE